MSQQAAAALIAAIPVGAGAAGAANADARRLLLQDFMREDGNVLQVDNILGMLTPLTEDAVKMSVPDDMDLSSIGLVRQFFEEIVQIPRNSGEASNDYTKRCLDIVQPLLCETALSREVDLETTEECPAFLTTVVHFRNWESVEPQGGGGLTPKRWRRRRQGAGCIVPRLLGEMLEPMVEPEAIALACRKIAARIGDGCFAVSACCCHRSGAGHIEQT